MFDDNNMMGGGPEGKWTNRNTGETLYVMNSVMDGESMVLITDHGELTGPDIEYFMNNYVKASEDTTEYQVTNAETGTVTKMPENGKSQVKQQPTISKLQKEDDDFYIDDIPYISTNNNTQIQQKTQEEPQLKNKDIIKKLFDKIDSKPQIHLTIDWADFPKNEISTLVNFLDVDISDISRYIEKEFMTTDEISGEITKIIESKLNENN